MVIQMKFETASRFARPVRTMVFSAVISTFAMSAGAASTFTSAWEGVNLDGIAGIDAWYNTESHTTWLAGPDPTKMTWQTAKDWASGLNVFGSADWRLPVLGGVVGALVSDTPRPSFAQGELGQLAASFATVADMQAQFPTLQNAGSSFGIWYGNAVDGYGADNAWALSMTPAQNVAFHAKPGMGQFEFAWAVHDGDLRNITASVPEPHESTMLIAGVMAMGFMARRRRTRGSSR
jgi:hypothetical protein